jgi:hypothetical protein
LVVPLSDRSDPSNVLPSLAKSRLVSSQILN